MTSKLMESLSEAIIGYSGASLIVLGMTSQVIHSLKTKHFKGLSKGRIATDILSNAMFLTYASMTKNFPVVISASSVIISNVIIVISSCYEKEEVTEFEEV